MIYSLKEFLEEYDNGNLLFNNLRYRSGAKITAPFGLTEGYRIVNNRYVWDSIRIHTGVDRASKNKKGENKIISPFDFERSIYYDYGGHHVYGSVLRLFNDKYKFEMRIMHILPNEINSVLKEGKGINRNEYIGKAGAYGSSSTGRHTHTEIISYEKNNIIFESLLKIKYGVKEVSLPHQKENIIKEYKKYDYWMSKTSEKILKNYKLQLLHRKIKNNNFNRYKYIYQDWYWGYGSKINPQYHTRYSSELLFNGL